MKTCTKCNIEKNLFEFSKKPNTKDGLAYKCKQCYKEYHYNNINKIKENHKNYFQNLKNNSPEKYKTQYNKSNKNKDYKLKWFKEKYKTDNIFKIITIIKSRIHSSLKTHSKTKNNKTLIYLGCDINEFKTHLESQFLPEMNWENHGVVWEIDHIIAISNFDLTKEEEQLKAFHYSNTQPLFKTTEISEQFGYKNFIGNRNKSNK